MIKSKFLLGVMLCLFPIFVHANDPFSTTAEPQPDEILASALVTDPAMGETYQVVLVKQNSSIGNLCTLKVYQIKSLNLYSITDTDLRFVVILPDGNFQSLLYSDNLSGSYSKTIHLQKSVQNHPINLNTSNMSVWLLKKNDPTPPPPPSARIAIPGGANTLPGEGSPSVGDIDYETDVTPYNSKSDYLDIDEAINISTLWPPWPNSDAYYYIVVSYSKKLVQGSVENVSVVLEYCSDDTGFAIDSFFYFSPTHPDVWLGSAGTYLNPAISPSQITVNIDDLETDEVRHIYYRLKRVGNETNKPVAQYKAYLKYNNIGPLPPGPSTVKNDTLYLTGVVYNTGCYDIPLKITPHDPNKKIPSTEVCTADGTGEIIYTIHFQNEGRGWAKDVIVYDTLPRQIDTNSIVFIGASSKCSFSKSDNHLKFTLKDIYLPGSSQSAPRYFAYGETTGWVQFSCKATCPSVGQKIENQAGIVFFDVDSIPQNVIMTPKSITVSDATQRPAWTLSPIKPCDPPKMCCLRLGRCRWCWTKVCRPRVKREK